jgi:hypothetical protein
MLKTMLVATLNQIFLVNFTGIWDLQVHHIFFLCRLLQEITTNDIFCPNAFLDRGLLSFQEERRQKFMKELDFLN